eukprot:scaffold63205_cov75-Phaeocystis_antarctica.AAC.1
MHRAGELKVAQLLLVKLVVGRVGHGVVGHGGLDGVEHGELGRAEEAGEEVLARGHLVRVGVRVRVRVGVRVHVRVRVVRGHEGYDEEGDEEAEGREVDGPAEACVVNSR